MIGTRLGRYDIIEKLGEGGMGVVFQARDASLDRFVAIKVLPPDKLSNADRKQRFIREAKAASALNHPNIITIHEVGEQDGADFIVMEYVAGRTLEQLIVRGGMRLGDLLRIAIPVADALARAHAAGITHRDLKPGNIMAGDDGQVKLLDFGLAKLSEDTSSGEADVTRTVQQQTEEGTVLGTVAYMSPEQAEARKLDARSDIFSFGVVLYEMATGQRPFQGNSKLSTMAAILHTEPKPPHEIAAAIPRDLERVIARCLRKDPAWRYQSAADLKVSLAELERETTSGIERVAVPKPRPALPRWIAPLAAGLALGLLPVWWLARRAPSAPAAVYTVRPLTTFSGLESEPSLSPDGNQVAFAWNGEKRDNFDIYVRLVDGSAPLRLTTDAAPDRSPAWSPDGRRIVFVRGKALYAVPALGGNERQIVSLPEGRINSGAVSWSPDGKSVALSAAGKEGPLLIHLVAVETGELKRLPGAPAGWSGDEAPAFAPDGRTLAFIRRKDLYSRAILFQDIDAGGDPRGSPREITSYSYPVNHIAWMPSGQGLVASITMAAVASLFRVTLKGELQPLGIESGNAAWPSLSRSGDHLAYAKSHADYNLWAVDGPGPDGGPRPYEKCNPRVVVDSTAADMEPMLSPDGARLAFSSTRGGTREIYVANADGSGQEAVSSVGPRSAGSPRWSPDGQNIVFDHYEAGHPDVYVVRAQGGKARRLTTGTASYTRPSWSRDGKWIYYSSNQTGRNELWKIAWNGAADPGQPVQLTQAGGNEAFESPGGAELLFNAPGGLFSMPPEGGEAKLVLPNLQSGRWAAAGRSIYYYSNSPRAISVLRRDTGRQFEYARFPAGSTFGTGATAITVSPDERRIYFTQLDRVESDLMLVENFR